MESNSIVSFNNDSTFQSTVKSDYNNVHELALHAMRDRCLLLQRRINTLETDNMRLKLEMTKKTEFPSNNVVLADDEKYQLHQKIAELSKQKSHLMHHVFMVTCENKSLWTKLSRKSERPQAKLEGSKHAPLLRTNTYIHSTSKNNDQNQEKYSESSLEEISLKLINSYIQEKSQLVDQYEQMSQLQDLDEDILNVDSIGFTYIDDPPSDSLKEIQEETENLMRLKKDLLEQERDLKIILSRVEIIMRDGWKCPGCASKSSKNVSSEHKEIETSDSLANFATPVDSNTYNENYSDLTTFKKEPELAQVLNKDASNKCPMCNKEFPKDIDFNEFRTHVEDHFTGETEMDSLLDNFENISPGSVNDEI